MHKHLISLLAVTGLCTIWSLARADDREDRGQTKGRPSVGLMISSQSENSDQEGVIVQGVQPDGPAAKAGIKRGDIITRVDGREVTDGDTLINVLARHKAGDKLRFHVLRDGNDKTVTVTLGQRSERHAAGESGGGTGHEQAGDRQSAAFLGVQTAPIDEMSDRMKKRLGISGEEGVVVIDVVPDSPPARAGLRHGDVIVSVNNKQITGQEQLRRLVHQAGVGKTVKMEIRRGDEEKKLQAKLEAAPSDLAFSQEPGDLLRGLFRRQSGYGDGEQRQLERLERQVQRLQRRVEELEEQLKERQGSKK